MSLTGIVLLCFQEKGSEDGAGSHGVDADLAVANLFSSTSSKADDAVLGGGVGA